MNDQELEERFAALDRRIKALETGNPRSLSPAPVGPTIMPSVPPDDRPVSTIELPKFPTAEVTVPAHQRVDFVKQSELDEKAKEANISDEELQREKKQSAPTGEPIPGYDRMTIGEIQKNFRATVKTAAERDRWLAYERAHQNRDQLVTTYVNWNS